jgi:hypothetical protein
MAENRKRLVSFYLQFLSFSGDRKWPETESGQRKEAARERKGFPLASFLLWRLFSSSALVKDVLE